MIETNNNPNLIRPIEMKTNELQESKGLATPFVSNSPSKLILENRTDLSLQDFLTLANEVVKMGRISNGNKQFCYLTAFTIDNEEYHIVSDLNNKSDKLTFYKVPTRS